MLSRRASIVSSAARGRLPCARARSARTAHIVASDPSTPDAPPITRLSANSCRIRRPRVAPSAVRTAISRSRPIARTSERFDTLRHATSSTTSTAPVRMSIIGFASPVTSCVTGRSSAPVHAPVGSGYVSASRRSTVASSASARVSVTPGARRPMTRASTCRQRLLNMASVGARVATGVHSSAKSGSATPAGITPMICTRELSNRRTRPTTDRSPPKCESHAACESTPRPAPAPCSSSAEKERPSSGRAPRMEKIPV